MSLRLRSLLLTLCVAGICGLVLFGQRPEAAAPGKTVRLEAADGLQWYRGNIHTHSLWSDGDDYPEMIGLWYRDHGYDFLCYTDHNVLPQVERPTASWPHSSPTAGSTSGWSMAGCRCG